MRTWSLAIFAPLLALPVWLSAQQMPQAGGNVGASTNVGGGRTSRPSIGETDPTLSNQRPIFLSGKVVLDDGSMPLEPIKIERVCGGGTRIEAYTDRKGHFSFEVGRNREFQDASENPMDNMPGGGGFGQPRGFGTMNNRTSVESSLFGCEIRAALAGFRSDNVPLMNIHYLDNPDIGTIILHRVAKVDGLTVSATLALAPKDAKKAFEKGQEALGKRNPDEAQKNFQKAVEIYPRHAAAWFELGKIQEQRDHTEEARKAYEQSIGADSKYVPPHQRLAAMAFNEKQWQVLADQSAEVLKLDPVDYPDAYYMNAVAQLQLMHFDVAEKQVREAIRLDSSKKMLRAYYILGLAQAQQEHYSDAAQSIRTFLAGAGEAQDVAAVRTQLEQIEQLVKENSGAGPAAPGRAQ